MKTANNERKITTLSILLVITAGLTYLLITSLSANDPAIGVVKKNNDKGATLLLQQQNDKIQQYGDLLNKKLIDLRLLDKEYAHSLTTPGNSHEPELLNRTIYEHEREFNTLVDSIGLQAAGFQNGDIKNNFSRMVTSFRMAADNRDAMRTLRNVVAMRKDGLSKDEKAMLRMQDELDQKTKKIAALESSLTQSVTKNNELSAYSLSSDDNAKRLSENISGLENKIVELSTANTVLKQDNDRLLRQQNETVKNNRNNEAMLNEKNAGMQQKVDALNAELRLAHVDCNLDRVDATQIISTAKQRKELLTEASSILTDLSISNNMDIRRKAKDKIVRLNQVAANSRE